MTLTPGRKLGPYEIIGPIGGGGMGEVHRALDPRVSREVALKILPLDFAGDPERRSRFEREARMTASLSHPNIVALLDVGLDQDPPFLVSELVPGETLRSLLGDGPLPLRKALDIAAQVAAGLASAHAAGIVHRDIKPENLMVTRDGQVKILDFGLGCLRDDARPVSPDDETRTSAGGQTGSGLILGTVAYMSPEQAKGKPVDYRSDQFSLGLVLYEMLAGKQAFKKDSAVQTMAAIIEEDPPPLSRSLPTQVRWTLDRCLAKDPPHRYDSTADLAHEVRMLRDHLSDLTQQSGTASAQTRPHRGRRLAAGVSGALVLALAGLIAGRLSTEPQRVDLSRYRLAPFATTLRAQSVPAWSPDGRTLAFFGSTEDAGPQIYLQGADASTPVLLTRPPFAPIQRGAEISWTPDGRAVYAPGSNDTEIGLFRIPTGGGDPQFVRGSIGAYAISPDCKTVVMFSTEGEGSPWELWWASPIDAPARRYEPPPFQLKIFVDVTRLTFAPDGTKLFVSYNNGERRERWVLPWPPGKGRRILEPLSDQNLTGISWMRDSRHLALVTDAGAQRQVFIDLADTRRDSSWPIHLQSNPVVGISVSPDGRRIAFGSDHSHVDVIELPMDGGQPATVAGGSCNEEMPMLSGDGRQLVYVTDRRGPSEIVVRDMDTGTERTVLRLEDLPAGHGEPQWFMAPTLSRDRQRLAFSARVGTSDRLYVAFTGGGAPVLATSQDADMEFAPTWSPDGAYLAYRRGASGRVTLSIVRAGSADPPRDILDSPYGVPEWSPRGDWIASSCASGLMIVSPDGTERRRLSTVVSELAWAPDGGTLHVIRSDEHAGELCAIDIRTGGQRTLRDLGELIPVASLEPGRRVSVTPDGHSLVYSVLRLACEIWTLDGVRNPEPWYARLVR